MVTISCNENIWIHYVGKSFSGFDYALARHKLQVISRRVVEQIESYDVVLLPVTSKPTPLSNFIKALVLPTLNTL